MDRRASSPFLRVWSRGFILPLLLCAQAASAGLPEPAAVIYGQLQDATGNPVTAGNLRFEFTPSDGSDVIIQEASVGANLGDGVTFKTLVPIEYAPPGFFVQGVLEAYGARTYTPRAFYSDGSVEFEIPSAFLGIPVPYSPSRGNVFGPLVYGLDENSAGSRFVSLKKSFLDWFSINLDLTDASAASVFGDLNGLVLVQGPNDELYVPPNVVVPGHPGFDSLSPVQRNRGYQVILSGKGSENLQFIGKLANPTTVCLDLPPEFLNWIPCPYVVPKPMEEIINEASTPELWENLQIFQNELGQVYLPPDAAYPGHPGINEIGDMLPGEGYKLIHTGQASIQLCYPPESSSKASGTTFKQLPQPSPHDPVHFKPFQPQGKSQPIFIANAAIDGKKLEPGDEVGVFDENLCVGAIRIGEPWPIEPVTVALQIPYPFDTNPHGAIEEKSIRFVAWDSSTDTEFKMDEIEVLSTNRDLVFQEARVLSVALNGDEPNEGPICCDLNGDRVINAIDLLMMLEMIDQKTIEEETLFDFSKVWGR